jgi:hypothetical protein
LDFGPFVNAGAPGFADAPVSYGPRRTVLDKLLVGAAAEAGAEIRDGRLARVVAGVTSPADFFSEENIGRIMAGAGT